MFDLSAALDRVTEWGGSDLHLKHSSPPLIRIHGDLQAIPQMKALDPEDTEHALSLMLTNPMKREEFETEGEVDFSYEHDGSLRARFRVNAFRAARIHVAGRLRSIPFEPPLARGARPCRP